MILDRIVASRQLAHAARDRGADAAAADRIAAAPPVRSLAARLANGPRLRVIAEFKRRSPSAGALRPGGDAAVVAASYARAGAAALSVLTDEELFDGRLADIPLARAATVADGLPVLRKDFVLHDEDLLDARLAGADAALLIARLLPSRELAARLATATSLGLEALVEVHTEEECDRALAAGARLIGVNHRDLDTLTIDLDLSARLAPRLAGGVIRVAESGLKTADDLARMADRGYHAALIGEALLRAPSPGAALAVLLGALPCG